MLMFSTISRSVVYLEIDNRQCYQQSTECFQSATDVAAFLGALATSGNLNVPYIEAVTSMSLISDLLHIMPIHCMLCVCVFKTATMLNYYNNIC